MEFPLLQKALLSDAWSPSQPWASLLQTTWSTLLITTLICLLPTLYLLSRLLRNKQSTTTPTQPFPFLSLPAELRNEVYTHLLTSPSYPPPSPTANHPNRTTIFGYRLPTSWRPSTTPTHLHQKETTGILLASRQIHTEYTSLLLEKAPINLHISPSNYPSTPLWKLPPNTLSRLRKCNLNLTLTSAMLGVQDPNHMDLAHWDLARRIEEELRDVDSGAELSVHVKALGDPLWNPIWLWYHAGLAFVGMGESESSSSSSTSTSSPSTGAAGESSCKSSSGPRFSKITFGLDNWAGGENHLERGADGEWGWYCAKGHCVGAEMRNGARNMAVREFCAALIECGVCMPEADD